MARTKRSRGEDGEPDGPTDLPKESLLAVIKRARAEFRNDHLTTLAAALTYYGVLAMVPGLLVLFTALGVLRETPDQQGGSPGQPRRAPGSAGHFVQTLLLRPNRTSRGTGIMAIVGLVIALWSASSYVNGFRQASNVIYGIGEGRPLWKTMSIRLAVTVFAVVVLMVCAFIVVVSGSIANEVGNAVGLGQGR